jgi:hypothetical protein
MVDRLAQGAGAGDRIRAFPERMGDGAAVQEAR